MSGPFRLRAGGLIDRGRPLTFRFDGRPLSGYAGDTLASALLGAGVRLVGRSFKYHRPRGIVTAGPEEPNALVERMTRYGREPNVPATMIDLSEGLVVDSQNRWPSLDRDIGAINGLFSRFLGAGFYYKTFMAPSSWWERRFEPAIRRAAGLGRLQPVIAGDGPSEIVHDHADVLVVGSGAAGLAAAAALADAGARVILAEQMPGFGGATLLDPAWEDWRETQLARLAAPDVRLLARTTVVGAYGHGVFAAVERLDDGHGPRERLRVIRAARLLLAGGAVERLIAFPGNDLPGVMLAGAALAYLRLHGVAVGSRPVLYAANDTAYEAAFALQDAGVTPVAIIDPRPASAAAERARSRGLRCHLAHTLQFATGDKRGVVDVRVERIGGDAAGFIACDSVLLSGGFSPATALATQAGGRARWDETAIAFVPEMAPSIGRAAGAARGLTGLAAAAGDGFSAAVALAADLGLTVPRAPDAVPRDLPMAAPVPLWRSGAGRKAFVDLQNDVTVEDIELARREGYEHVEHAKRYTTHGMGTDQGKIGGLVGSAVLAEARGVSLAETGLPTPRPFVTSVPWAALAGPETGADMKPKRLLPLHDWHERAGATFALTGIWLRPLVYSRESGWAPVLREAAAVRRSVGITDVSSLGKIDVQGADAARFLDLIYANTFSTLPVGRCRYGIMLREDGMMMDDGTTSRLGDCHFLLTTTTANTQAVLDHLEFHAQAVWPDLDVHIADVTEQWAAFAVAGPQARSVVARVVAGVDLDDAGFPFMAAAEAVIAGVAGRLFRISFSGELAYELAVPARAAEAVWTTILAAGEPEGIIPYGLDALNTLRIEKGHVTGAEMNGTTTMEDLGFGKMAKRTGAFIGRVLRERPGLSDPTRQRLVGVRPVDPAHRLRNGAHLVDPAEPTVSLGFITSSTPSVELEGWVGLALLSGGLARKGEVLLARSPITAEDVPVAIVSPHFVDPGNERVRSTAGIIDGVTRVTTAASVDLAGVFRIREIRTGRGSADLAVGRVVRRGAGVAIGWKPGTTLLLGDTGAVEDGVITLDRSSALVPLIVAGPAAREALARLCRLDLDPRRFPVGHAATTVMAQVGVTIARLHAAPVFLLLTPPTTARHLRTALGHAAHSFGDRVRVADAPSDFLPGDLIDEE